MGPRGKYLDKFGEPANRYNDPGSHIYPTNTLPGITVWPGSDQEYQDYYQKLDQYNLDFDNWFEENKENIRDWLEDSGDEQGFGVNDELVISCTLSNTETNC